MTLLGMVAALMACGEDTGGGGDGGGGTGMVGKQVAAFTLPQCDGTPYDFLGSAGASTRFTVLSIAAGWCVPCVNESRELTARVTTPYASRGVRVVQALVQDPDYRDVSESYCSDWVTRFGLTNVELRDPDGELMRYWPDMVLPATFIVDSAGVIRFHESGAADGLGSLTAALDRLLATP